MANTNNMRRTHSSPGVYFNENELTYSSNSLGITTLGVAGETLKGPAFQPITIENWRQFQTYFGGTSTEKYRGSQYPKYELPYIAKSYLEQSKQLEVVRVLGLSGVNAGPAWVMTTTVNTLNTKNVYDKLSYEPTEIGESEWVWSGEGQNSFKIGEELPGYIVNPIENSPNYYRQVISYTRPEVDYSVIPEGYSWAGRVFNSIDEMYNDTVLIDGYARINNGNGYEYTKMSSAPSPSPSWVFGENYFCELPQTEPGENSHQYIKVGCKSRYDELDNTPSPVPNWVDFYNWFNNTDLVSQYEVENNMPNYVRVNESEYKTAIAPTILNEYNDLLLYVGDIAVDASHNVYKWSDEGYVSYKDTEPTLNDLTEVIVYNGVKYNFVVDSSDSDKIYCYNGSVSRYSNENDYTNISVKLADYIVERDENTPKVYKWVENNTNYNLIDFIQGYTSSTIIDTSYDNPAPDITNIVIPYGVLVPGKPSSNNLYKNIDYQKYDFTVEVIQAPTNFTTYYAKENDKTGGAKDVRLLKRDIDLHPELEYANICTPSYVLYTGIPSSIPTDLGYEYAVSQSTVDSLSVDKGEYVSLNTEIRYLGPSGPIAPLSIVVNASNFKTTVSGYSNSSAYRLSDLTVDEANDAYDFTFVDINTFVSGFETQVNDKEKIPTAINIGGLYYKLKVYPTVYERTCQDNKYYKAKPIEDYSLIITSPDRFFKRVDNVEYYQKTLKAKYYEVNPVFNYFKKEVVSYQTETPNEECCEENINTVVAVLRSRGEHKKAKFVRQANAQDNVNGICNDIYEYDGIEYFAKEVWLEPSKSMMLGSECTPGFSASSQDFSIDANNYGRFTIVVKNIYGEEKRYAVSLNPTDRNYIYNVIGGNPEEGDAEVYVEELYDVALRQMIEAGQANAINGRMFYYPEVYIKPSINTVDDLLTTSAPVKSQRGKRYLYSPSEDGVEGLEVIYSLPNNVYKIGQAIAGHIYTVEQVNTTITVGSQSRTIDGLMYVCHCTSYENGSTSDDAEKIIALDTKRDINDANELKNAVKVKADDMFYIALMKGGVLDVYPVTFDMNNYREPFRYSSTPWILSEIKADATNVELTKLFRFHTISDGSNSLGEVKISIENIDPDLGTFDVVIRDFNDTDYSPSVVEKYIGCNLVPGSNNYIGLKIGSFDGTYEPKSKYVTVEVNENDITEVSTPAGFMGYPIRDYTGEGINVEQKKYEVFSGTPISYKVYDSVPFYAKEEYIKVGSTYYHAVNAFADGYDKPRKPWFKYNTSIIEDVRAKKQYFGVSDLVGIDTDVLKYKGVEAYNGLPNGMTACFHLDSRILNGTPDENGVITGYGNIEQTVKIDGIGGYSWVTVGMNNTTDFGIEPRIGDEATMRGTIYEDKKYRKFTVAMYGGWDGWDFYRTSRSNTNDFTYSNYRGSIDKTSGFGAVVNELKEPEAFGLEAGTKCLDTDYYAYLGAIKQFANPRMIEINVLATPGIDYVNNGLLVDDVIEMVEEERADALYVVTTPDKPFGAGDSVSEMYSEEDAVYNLEGSDIDTNRACTYYPWEKYYDETNYQYIYLPITRDVVRSIAYTDNITHPWYAPAGWNRGDISGVAPRKKLKVNETDILYNGRINYVNSFAKEGDKIWGNKNLQIAEGQLNRISTRRLLLRIKKLCDKACIGLVFDPNDSAMAKTLESSLKSILDNIKSNRGIYDYKIEVDDSVEARERLELPARIFIKPTKLVEYITIEATLVPEGFKFI